MVYAHTHMFNFMFSFYLRVTFYPCLVNKYTQWRVVFNFKILLILCSKHQLFFVYHVFILNQRYEIFFF